MDNAVLKVILPEGQPESALGEMAGLQYLILWRLTALLALAADSFGNVYIADNGNYRIRKINQSTGILSTIIGNGSGSYSGDGGLGVSAGITSVNSICVNKQGDVFFCDVNCYRIRKLNHSTAHISTIAGNGSSATSGDGGPATGASISRPHGICVDNAGNVYFGDGYRVRKITASTGYISTVAGTGTNGYSGDGGAATSANLNIVTSVVCDQSGNIFFSQGSSLSTDSCRIRKIDASGIITTIAGGGQQYADGCNATVARLLPTSLSIDSSGSLYCNDMSLYSYNLDYFGEPPYSTLFMKVINVATGLINNYHNSGILTPLSSYVTALPVACIGKNNQFYYEYEGFIYGVSGAGSGINNLEIKDTLTSAACTLPAKYNVIINGSINGTPVATDSVTVIINYKDSLIDAGIYDSLVGAPRNTTRTFRLPYTYSGGFYHFGSTSVLDSFRYTFPGTYYPQVQIFTTEGYSDWYALPIVHAGSGCGTTSLAMGLLPLIDTFLSSPCTLPRTVGFTVQGFFGGASSPAATDSAYILFDYSDGSPLELHVVAYDTSGGYSLNFTATHVYTATGDYYPTVWVNNSAGNAVGEYHKDVFFEWSGGNPLVRISDCSGGHISTTIAESGASTTCDVPATITYHYSGSVSDSAILDSTARLNVYFGDGSSAVVTAPVVYQTSTCSYILNGYFSHVFSTPGVYTSAHNDSIGTFNTSGFINYGGADTFAISNSCAPLNGCVYFDANGNCSKDRGESGLGYWPYELVNNTLHDTLYGWCNDTGGYALSVITGYSYTLLVNYLSTSGSTLRASCPATGEYSFTAVAGHSYPESFALSCDTTSGVDMSVSGWGYGFVPGDTGAIAIWSSTPWGYTCDTLSSNIRLILDSRLTYRGMWDGGPTPSSISGDTINWHFTTIAQLLDFSGFVMVTTSTSATIYDTIVNSLYVSPTRITDPYLANNSYSFTTPVSSSFDPNEMQVSPQGFGSQGYIPNNSPLSYLVRFQNTGTASARNITISDSLSTNLDISTLQVISSSGPVLVAESTGNVVTFRFNDINLQDSSTGRYRSTGYVAFNILPREGLAPNTEIKNSAGVYFDYNAPVFTNQTINTIEDTTGISGGSTVCTGAGIELTTPIALGSWLASNANATVSAGVVTGIHTGIDTITYSVYGGDELFTKIITISTLPSAGTLSGSSVVCAESSVTLTPSLTGGTWRSVSTSLATVAGGVVYGVSAGTDSIYYTITNSCGSASAAYVITIDTFPASGYLSGATTVCTGSLITLTPSVSGGSWRSESSSLATVSAGLITGVSPGTDTIFYTVTNSCGSAYGTRIITINPAPVSGTITGITSLCMGTSDTLIATSTGGSWSSESSSLATVAGGIVVGLYAGIDTIIYTVTNSCGSATARFPITIYPLPLAGSLSGPASVCTGASIVLIPSVSGGAWSSAISSLATVSGGVISGVAVGSDTIVYTVTNSCGSASVINVISINTLPSVGTISGLDSVCPGDNVTLTNSTSVGTWSSTNSAIATVNSVGNVTGVSAGTVIISYAVTNSCGTVAATDSFVVRQPADCPTSVNEITVSTDGVSLFPNPSAGVFAITLPGHQGSVSITISDLEGKMIRQMAFNNNNILNIPIDFSNMAAGAYFVKIQVDGEVYRKKFIIL